MVFGTYRGHALYLAKGGDVPRMMAELYGKVDGCARGKAGSMHLVDPSVDVMGTSAVVRRASPTRWARAGAQDAEVQVDRRLLLRRGRDRRGRLAREHELRLAKKLPILFVCENNFYAIYSHVQDRMAGPRLRRAPRPTASRPS